MIDNMGHGVMDGAQHFWNFDPTPWAESWVESTFFSHILNQIEQNYHHNTM